MNTRIPSPIVRLACASLLGAFASGGLTTSVEAQATTNSIPLNRVPARVLSALGDQDAFNALAQPLVQRILQTPHTNALIGFINDWNLRPKFLHATDGASDDSVLGLEYHFQKSIANRVFDDFWKNPMGLSLAFEAQGDVAVEAKKNPNNLLETSAQLHLFQGIGGINPTYASSEAAGAEFQQALMQNMQDTEFAAGRGKAYSEMARRLTAHMAPQFFWDFAGHATLEADQQFHDKQWAYGGKLSFAFRDWRAQSRAGWFNVFDYPFAAIRWLVDKEDFQPSGRVFPSVVLGLDLVDGSDNDTRIAVDPDTDAFPRGRAELAFKTRVLRWQDRPLYFSAAYRCFQEFSASRAIKAAHLDRSEYFVMRMDLPYRFNLSYATGKLPLDRDNDDVYAIGWALNF